MKRMTYILTIGFLAVSPAWGQGTPEQRRACKDDAYKLCPWEVPDPVKTEKCMRVHIKSLSPACRAQFGR
jgi:hypothetical protein